MRDNKWLRLLAYVTGLVNQELLLQNEYLTAETGSCDGTCRRDCVCPIPKGPRSPRRQATRTQGSGGSGPCGQASHHSGLVSQADLQQIRRLQTPQVSRAATNRAGS